MKTLLLTLSLLTFINASATEPCLIDLGIGETCVFNMDTTIPVEMALKFPKEFAELIKYGKILKVVATKKPAIQKYFSEITSITFYSGHTIGLIGGKPVVRAKLIVERYADLRVQDDVNYNYRTSGVIFFERE